MVIIWLMMVNIYIYVYIYVYVQYIYLVGGIPTPLNNMKVSWDDDIPNMRKHKK